jgi:hypothetical protein
MVLISVEEPTTIVRMEGLGQLKNPMTSVYLFRPTILVEINQCEIDRVMCS